MPYPRQITLDALVETAAQMVEQDGLERLSLARLAQALGVKAPSLYKHVQNKSALIRAVNNRTAQGLVEHVRQIATVSDPMARLTIVARTYRSFALEHPTLYSLAFTTADPALTWDADAAEQSVLPLQAIMADLVGEDAAHLALRGLMALVHGFAMLQIHGQLRREGSIDAAFEASVAAFLAGWGGITTST